MIARAVRSDRRRRNAAAEFDRLFDGTTRTFYRPDPASHGYPTNWDYWMAQPGS